MTTSIVVCTYNWPEALELVILSASRQTVIPNEVVIADDGSRDNTKELIDRMRPNMPFKLLHAWQEDKGFRLATAANRAFAMCTSDYIIQIGGDIIMDKHFVEDHIRHAATGYYLSGSRGKLTDKLSQKFFKCHDYSLSPFTIGVTRKLNVIRLPFFTPLFYKYKLYKLDRGCNMSFWREDLYAVNGYDGDMVGYGNEDTDLSARIRRLGVKKRCIKFSCIEYHIYHDETPSKNDKMLRSHNRDLEKSNTANNIIRIKNGIDRYL